jgi:hypothetical protein
MAKRFYPKEWVLTRTSDRVNETEQALGPMNDMRRTPEKNGFTFAGGEPPETRVLIVQKVAGVAAQPPGSTKICEGPLWNANVRIDAVAYRLKA